LPSARIVRPDSRKVSGTTLDRNPDRNGGIQFRTLHRSTAIALAPTVERIVSAAIALRIIGRAGLASFQK
jgi:hypothetical protein